MSDKTIFCEICHKKFVQNHPKTKFCSDECRAAKKEQVKIENRIENRVPFDDIQKINRNPYKLAKSEHNHKVSRFAKLFGGKIVHTTGGEGKYFSDLIKDGVHYEMQHFTKSYLKKKFQKWDKEDKHTLVVMIPEEIAENFDEIYLFHGDKLHKL